MQYECKQISKVYMTCIFCKLKAMCQALAKKKNIFNFEFEKIC